MNEYKAIDQNMTNNWSLKDVPFAAFELPIWYWVAVPLFWAGCGYAGKLIATVMNKWDEGKAAKLEKEKRKVQRNFHGEPSVPWEYTEGDIRGKE